jgi:hypothetical protein
MAPGVTDVQACPECTRMRAELQAALRRMSGSVGGLGRVIPQGGLAPEVQAVVPGCRHPWLGPPDPPVGVFKTGPRGPAAGTHKSPVVSGCPYIRLKFCTATPAAPLMRLSRQASTTMRPRTTRTVMSQKLV